MFQAADQVESLVPLVHRHGPSNVRRECRLAPYRGRGQQASENWIWADGRERLPALISVAEVRWSARTDAIFAAASRTSGRDMLGLTSNTAYTLSAGMCTALS